MRKPAFCIFCGLCILTLFSLLTVNMRGVSNKHCLLPFFHSHDFCEKEKLLEINCHENVNLDILHCTCIAENSSQRK